MARLAPELDADDLLQELFLIVLRKPGALSTVASPRAWLYGVAIKLATTRRRTARARRFFGLEVADSTAAVDSASRTIEQRDAQRRVQKALESVSAAKRETFVLFELQGLSGDEVAEALGVPVKTVWTRLFQTRKEVLAAIERQLVAEARTSGLTRGEIQP
jgi:RNA polymerase sigma-70 factor (ECF subfamily)